MSSAAPSRTFVGSDATGMAQLLAHLVMAVAVLAVVPRGEAPPFLSVGLTGLLRRSRVSSHAPTPIYVQPFHLAASRVGWRRTATGEKEGHPQTHVPPP